MTELEQENWFEEEWSDPEPELALATEESVLDACADIFTESDLQYIKEHNLDLAGLTGYLDGMLRFHRSDVGVADFLKERGLQTPAGYESKDSLYDKLSKHGRKLFVGAMMASVMLQAALLTKTKTVAWPSNTKSELAQKVFPSAEYIGKQIALLRRANPNEVSLRTIGSNDFELEMQSFDSANYYDVKVEMSGDPNGVPDPKATHNVDIYTGGYIDDGSDSYDGKNSRRQEVELSSVEDVSGDRIWKAQDWQWVPGEMTPSMNIDPLSRSGPYPISSVKENSALIKRAVRQNAIWADYSKVEFDEAVSGNIQDIKK